MNNQQVIFTTEWIVDAGNAPDDSWVRDVVDNIDTSGGEYLRYLTKWYFSLPPDSDHEGHLKRRLQNYTNTEHLGGANELAWWAYMKQSGFDVLPEATAGSARPDFQVSTPGKFYAEVTTLNLSEFDEKVALTKLAGAHLTPARTLDRIANTCVTKVRQLKYGFCQGLPSVLVIFDYSAFSGLGVQTIYDIEKTFFTNRSRVFSIHKELSALVYIVRAVSDGQPVFVQSKSIVFHNPFAKYELGLDMLPYLIQHTGDCVFEPRKLPKGFILLSDEI